jgi:hypothetical protein
MLRFPSERKNSFIVTYKFSLRDVAYSLLIAYTKDMHGRKASFKVIQHGKCRETKSTSGIMG